jgi:aminoglycoside phosphotransferase (APT) family kinase protein
MPGGYGVHWLTLVVPAAARRFRVTHPTVAAALADAGAELVERGPDVEISPASELQGAAAVAVVSVESPLHDGALPLLARAVRRIALSIRARAAATRAARALARRGYRASVLPWDLAQSVQVAPVETSVPAARRRLPERFPQCFLAVGRRGTPGPSVLEAVLASASESAGRSLRARSASVRAGFVLVRGDDWVLRVAIGPTRGQLHGHVRVLTALGRLPAPPEVVARVPTLLGAGRHGLADWLLEELLPGSPPRVPFPGPLLDECVDYLVALHTVPGSEVEAQPLGPAAEVVGACSRSGQESVARLLADRLELALSEIRRGFAHGDFFPGNLLAEGGRLVGVVDWDAGGQGRLPLVDLLHLRLHLTDPPADHEWGPAIVRRLLPWARRGGDPLAREYLRRIGVEPHPRTLEALVVTYWLERTAYQLQTHAIRQAQPRWLAANVDGVLDALSGSPLLAPGRSR